MAKQILTISNQWSYSSYSVQPVLCTTDLFMYALFWYIVAGNMELVKELRLKLDGQPVTGSKEITVEIQPSKT